MFFPYYMKPGHIASSAVDYLARKKGLILNSSDISKTILANVEAAEHKGVLVPEGTTVGYVLTVLDDMRSGWKISNADILLTSPNIWPNRQEFRTPPIVSYNYNDYSNTSTQVPTTSVVHTIMDTKFAATTLDAILSTGSSATDKTIRLLSSGSTHTVSSTDLTIANGTISTTYSMGGIRSDGLYTITSLLQGVSIQGQVVFDTSPHAPTPSIGNDVATKSYVDTLIGNYSGTGVNLYLNSDGVLSPSLSASSSIVSTTDIGLETLIATFTTPSSFPNTQILPSGLWSMTLYGRLNDNSKIVKYYFDLVKVSASNTVSSLGLVSGYGDDINTISAVPDAYHITLSIITPISLAATDRLRVNVYATSSDSTDITLQTYFGGNYYSYVTTSLSGGLSILTMDNNFTGNNVYGLQIKADGGITTTDLTATTVNITSMTATGQVSSGSLSTGSINANGGIETTTVRTTGLITATSGVSVGGSGISVMAGGITTNTLLSTGLITASNGVSVGGSGISVMAGGITTTRLLSTSGISVTAGGITTNALLSTGGISVTAGGITTNALLSTGGISVTAGGITTNALLSTGGISVTAGGITTNTLLSTGLITASNGVSVGGSGISVMAGGITTNTLLSTGGISVTAGGITTNTLLSTGLITASNGVSVGGSGISVMAGGITTNTLLSTGGISVTAGGITTNTLCPRD